MEELQRTNELLHGTLEAIYQSRFWRYSAPLRKARRWLDPVLQGMDWHLVKAPLHAVRGAGRSAANRPILRRPVKRLLTHWPGLRWRIWRFLLVTPEADEVGPFVVGSRTTGKMKRERKAFKMFNMSEPRQPIDIDALKARIRRERERQKAG